MKRWQGTVGTVVVMGLALGLSGWVVLAGLAGGERVFVTLEEREAADVCAAPEVTCSAGRGGSAVRFATFSARGVDGVSGDVRLEVSCAGWRNTVVWDVSLRLPVPLGGADRLVQWDWFGVSDRLSEGSRWALDGVSLRAGDGRGFVEDVLGPVPMMGRIVYGPLELPASLSVRVGGEDARLFAGYDLRRVRGVLGEVDKDCRSG